MEIKNLKKSFVKILVFSLFTVFSLAGCWSYREIESLAIAAGIAVDQGINHKYLVTMEIIGFQPGQEAEIGSKLVSGEGDSILEAIRNSYNISGQMGYFNHTSVFIISQDVAGEGILPIIDLLFRSPLIRISLAILISKEKTAREVLAAQSLNQPIKSFQISDAFAAQQSSLSKTLEIKVFEAINAIGSEGTALFLPTVGVITPHGQPMIELSGIAVFKQDRLVGLLDGEDSKYLLFVRNKVQEGILLKDMAQGDKRSITSLKIIESQTQIKPVLVKGKPLMKIGIRTKADIWELDSSTNYNSEPGRRMLKIQAEQTLQENIVRVIRKVQQDYGADIFGFGSRIRSRMPDVWKKIKPDWGPLFAQLKVEVKAEITIQKSGMAIKPIKTED